MGYTFLTCSLNYINILLINDVELKEFIRRKWKYNNIEI